MSKKHIIYTDGSCDNNGDWAGSWAWVEIDQNMTVTPIEDLSKHIIKKRSGYAYDTTNNRMEMMAIINAITQGGYPIGSSIKIFSDSGYVVNGHNNPSYLKKWMQNGWKTSKRLAVENKDLWEHIILIDSLYDVQYVLVKGHSKDKTSVHKNWNDLCDKICTHVRQYVQYRLHNDLLGTPMICTPDCKHRDQMSNQDGMCYNCPAILCGEVQQ